MEKDFEKWHIQKEGIHCLENNNIYFREGDIWWCRLGANIGFEQDGKGEFFSQPILVVKKFNQFIFWAIPLSTKTKSGPYYRRCVTITGETRTAIVSQLRLMSAKRLTNKIGFVEQISFETIKKAIKDLL